MKLDKTGGIAVLATIRAMAELKLPINVLGVIPSAENLPSGIELSARATSSRPTAARPSRSSTRTPRAG